MTAGEMIQLVQTLSPDRKKALCLLLRDLHFSTVVGQYNYKEAKMIPYCILVIEDDDDRTFMEQLFVDYHRLMYHEIFKLVHDQWAAEDVMQSTLVRLIDKIPELRLKDRGHLVNYIITASKNQARNYLRDSGHHSASDLQEFMEYEDPNMDGGAIELQIIEKGRPGGVGPYLDAAG